MILSATNYKEIKMKRLAVMLFLSFATMACAQIAEPARPMVQLPNSGLVTGSNPFPVTIGAGTGTASSILTASTGTQTVILLSSVAQAITSLANRKYISLIASGPFEYTVGSTTLITGNSSVYSTSFEANAAVPIGVSCSGVAVNLTARQWGN